MCRTPSLDGLEGSRVEISIAHHYLDAFIQGFYEILIGISKVSSKTILYHR